MQFSVAASLGRPLRSRGLVTPRTCRQHRLYATKQYPISPVDVDDAYCKTRNWLPLYVIVPKKCLYSVCFAAARISKHIHRTPVMTSSAIDDIAGFSVHFKCELLQRSGCFKIRGAANAVFALGGEEAVKGVVTQSSGNHGMATALAAQIRGVPAHVVVPQNTPLCKRQAIEGYGASLIFSGNSMAEREAKAAEVQQNTGSVLIHPYNDVHVMAGQGTIAIELLDQFEANNHGTKGLDAIVVPVSGGGMISGIAVAAKSRYPDIAVIAAEPSGANGQADIAMSLEAGHWIGYPDVPAPTTICDGLRGHAKDLTWAVIEDWVDGAVAVDDAAVLRAMRMVYERMKLVIEPSAAVGLAAVLDPKFGSQLPHNCENVGIILCGGNVDLDGFFNLLEKQCPQS